MNYMHLCFPGFLERAFTMSYDDGYAHDRRLVEIMNKYGVKGTFNINSFYMGKDGGTEKGRRLSFDEAREVYRGHEVAAHGAKHKSLSLVGAEEGLFDVIDDRRALEEEFGTIVRGMAYPNGTFDDESVDMIKKCGIVYSRTCKVTNGFGIPTDWLRLETTCRHKAPNLFELLDEFLAPPKKTFFRSPPRLFYLWGHSYEFALDDNWDMIERFLERIGNRDDIHYATNMELYEYIKAYDSLVFGVNGNMVYNPTSIDVYLDFWGRKIVAKAGETVTFS